MNINDTTVHKRVVSARIGYADLKKLAAQAIAGRAGVDLHLSNANVTRAYISNSNAGSITGGAQYDMEVTIEIDVSDAAAGAVPGLQSLDDAFAKGVL